MKALITGASSGIGRDIARELSKKGYDLVLVSRDEKKLNKVKEELEKENIKIEIISTDLSIEENCKEIHKNVKNVDILINNAGFGDCGNFTKTNLEKELNMIKTNITAYHILTKLYLIDMKKKGEGKILNVASIAGFMPGPLMATYYATKAYIVRLSESIREIKCTNKYFMSRTSFDKFQQCGKCKIPHERSKQPRCCKICNQEIRKRQILYSTRN